MKLLSGSTVIFECVCRSSNLCCVGRTSDPRDYSLFGSRPTKAFDAMGAFASMAFAFNTVILPEIQVSADDLYKCVYKLQATPAVAPARAT